MMACCIGEVEANSGGCVTGTGREFAAKNPLAQPIGRKPKGNLENGFRLETKTSLTLFAGGTIVI